MLAQGPALRCPEEPPREKQRGREQHGALHVRGCGEEEEERWRTDAAARHPPKLAAEDVEAEAARGAAAAAVGAKAAEREAG